MRMSTDEGRDEQLALETIAAAVDAGITVFDTARAYGDNESLVARALRRSKATTTARVVTKGGMRRAAAGGSPTAAQSRSVQTAKRASPPWTAWRSTSTSSMRQIPRTPWKTSVRALARLVDEGLVKRVGVANVNRRQLDEALELAPISAVQVALSIYDDTAVRGGIVERCEEAGIALIAHSPLGGPRRSAAASRVRGLAEVALARLLELSPTVVAIPGARQPETARSAARAAKLAP